MKRRVVELVIVYLVYLATLLLYIHLIHASVATALTSVIIWLIPLIVVLPTQFIAFIITVGWPKDNTNIDNRIYLITHLAIYGVIASLVGLSFIL